MSDIVAYRVLVGLSGVTCSQEKKKIQCTWDGVKNDRHYGRTKLAGVREKYVPKGTKVLNLRQVSIVSEEELQEIARRMGVHEVTGTDLGANVVLKNIPELTKISSGAIVKFSSGAILFVVRENLPCVFPGRNIQERYPDIPSLVRKFPKAAMGIRGLVAIVLQPGNIRRGDTVEII